MKVADDNIVAMRASGGPVARSHLASAPVYAAYRLSAREEEHDARGLVVAIALCIGCWVALGYFLLT